MRAQGLRQWSRMDARNHRAHRCLIRKRIMVEHGYRIFFKKRAFRAGSVPFLLCDQVDTVAVYQHHELGIQRQWLVAEYIFVSLQNILAQGYRES